MIISKKKFDEAIKEAVGNAIEEEHRKIEEQLYKRDQIEAIDNRFDHINQRISRAFDDIDKRLTELENQPTKVVYDSGTVCGSSKY